MVISEAVKLAMEQGKMIYREKVNRENEFVDVYINPTNSYNACIVILCNGGKEESSCRNWNPTGDDLMADDWELWMGNEFNKKVRKNKKRSAGRWSQRRRRDNGGEIL